MGEMWGDGMNGSSRDDNDNNNNRGYSNSSNRKANKVSNNNSINSSNNNKNSNNKNINNTSPIITNNKNNKNNKNNTNNSSNPKNIAIITTSPINRRRLTSTNTPTSIKPTPSQKNSSQTPPHPSKQPLRTSLTLSTPPQPKLTSEKEFQQWISN